MIDQESLAKHPAPWTPETLVGSSCWHVVDANDDLVCGAMSEAIAQAICDWRNAWQVMMDQEIVATPYHWGIPDGHKTKWGSKCVDIDLADVPDQKKATDPTAAVLAAKKWLEEQKS